MKKMLFIAALGALVFTACKETASTGTTSNYKVKKDQAVNMDSESEKFNYGLGMLIATTLQNNGIDSLNYSKVLDVLDDTEEEQFAYQITSREVQTLLSEEVDITKFNKDIIAKAMYDVLEGDTTLMNGLEVQQAYQAYMKNNQIKIGEANLAAGKSYLEGNANNEGVQTTPSGLQHLLIEAGTGEVPGEGDVIEVNYTGTSITGEEFDSSKGGDPLIIEMGDVNSAIPGFMQSLSLYPMGSKYRIFVPSNLAYGGQRLSPKMGPNSTLVFDIELVRTLDKTEAREYIKAKEAYMKQLQQMQQQQQQQQRN